MKNIKIVDANVILRYLLVDDEQLFQKAENIFNEALNLQVEILIKEAVIAEVVYVLEKFYKVSRKEISQTLKNLISLRGIKTENKNFILKALDIYSYKNLDFVDCILCAMSEQYDIETFDKKLNKCIETGKTN